MRPSKNHPFKLLLDVLLESCVEYRAYLLVKCNDVSGNFSCTKPHLEIHYGGTIVYYQGSTRQMENKLGLSHDSMMCDSSLVTWSGTTTMRTLEYASYEIAFENPDMAAHQDA